MSFQFPTDLQQSISAYVANGIYPNEETVLREAMRLLDQRQEDLASIQRGFDDIANGDTRPADVSNAEFRAAQRIPSES